MVLGGHGKVRAQREVGDGSALKVGARVPTPGALALSWLRAGLWPSSSPVCFIAVVSTLETVDEWV